MTTSWRKPHSRTMKNGSTVFVRGHYITIPAGASKDVARGGVRGKTWLTKCPKCGESIRFAKFTRGSAYFDDIGNLSSKHRCLYRGLNMKGTTDEFNLNLFDDWSPP